MKLSERERKARAGRILNARRSLRAVGSVHPIRSSPMRRAASWLYPWLDRPPGLYGLLTGLLGCSVGSLGHWLSGRRPMPDHVRLILIDTIRNRLEQGRAVLAELESMPDRPRRDPMTAINAAKAEALREGQVSTRRL